MVGREDAYLIVDDTALPKKGTHSLGAAPQYASALGKNANCQTLASLAPASGTRPLRHRRSAVAVQVVANIAPFSDIHSSSRRISAEADMRLSDFRT
jgi:hypothetical protein